MRRQVETILKFLREYYDLPNAKEEDFLEDIRLCLHGVGRFITVNREMEFIPILEAIRNYSNFRNDKDYYQEIELYSSYQLFCKMGKIFSKNYSCSGLDVFYKALSDFFKKYPNIVLVNRPVFEYKSRTYNVSTYSTDIDTFVRVNENKLIFLYPDIENNNLSWRNDTQVQAVVIE